MKNSYFIERTTCPVCEGTDFKVLYRAPYNEPTIRNYLNNFYGAQGGVEFEYLVDAEYHLAECENCFLIFQKFIPNDFLMVKLYDEWIDPDFDLNSTGEFHVSYFEKYAAEISILIRNLGNMPGQLNFLDFGMGWGKWSLMAKAFGCNSYGMELSEERIEHAQKNGITIVNWEEVPNYEFDFINTDQVFEHIPNPLKTLKHLSSSLRENGMLKICVPNGNRTKKILKKMDWEAPKRSKNSLNNVAPLEHINCYSTPTITKLAELCGLKPAKLKAFGSKEMMSIYELIKPYYYQLTKGGSTCLYFRKEKSIGNA